MIEDANVDEPKRIDQSAGDELVGLGRLCDAARVRMRQDHGGGVSLESFLDDLARVDRCAVDRSPEELDEPDDPMAVIAVRYSASRSCSSSTLSVREITGAVCQSRRRRSRLSSLPSPNLRRGRTKHTSAAVKAAGRRS